MPMHCLSKFVHSYRPTGACAVMSLHAECVLGRLCCADTASCVWLARAAVVMFNRFITVLSADLHNGFATCLCDDLIHLCMYCYAELHSLVSAAISVFEVC
jgi:hypothetical protein